MLQSDHGVEWSCSSLRKVPGKLRAGMAPHREGAQVDQLVNGLEQARASKGRHRPTLSVGRDGIFVPLRHGVWQEGAAATVSVLDRRGKRVGSVYLGQMPKAGQGTLTDQLSDLLKAILRRVDSQSLRLVSVTDEGYHPSTYYSPCPHKDDRSASSVVWPGVDTDCRFLSCLSIRPAAGRHDFRGRGRGAEVGERDAPWAQGQGRWGRASVKVRIGAAAESGALWPGQALR